MGRPKSLLSKEIINKIESDLKLIPDYKTVTKLNALKAAGNYKQSVVAKMYSISTSTLQRWANVYYNHGINGLKDKPKGHNPSRLTIMEKDTLKKWIEDCTDHTGRKVHWTLKRLKQEILIVFGKSVGKTPLWLSLKAMGLSLRKPRPRHYKADLVKQKRFKKNTKND